MGFGWPSLFYPIGIPAPSYVRVVLKHVDYLRKGAGLLNGIFTDPWLAARDVWAVKPFYLKNKK